MKNMFIGSLCLLTTIFTGHAHGANAIKDITPVSVRYSKVVVNDITGDQGLQIVLKVKNVGNTVIKASSGGVLVAAVWNTSAALYGPVGNGGYVLGGAIHPGEIGQFLFYAKLGALQHCLRSKVMVDTTRSIQSGPNAIYYNDSIVLPAVDGAALKLCTKLPTQVSERNRPWGTWESYPRFPRPID